MLFNSIEFALFLPIVFLIYWAIGYAHINDQLKLRLQNAFVVIASYVFYGWWDWRFLLLIAFTSFCSWGSGLLIGRGLTQRSLKGRRLFTPKFWMIANIILNLTILAIFKYYDFFVREFGQLFGISTESLLLRIILPVGISFYTFQALSYVVDVYRGEVKVQKDIYKLALYICLFPQLIAGPIVKYHDVAEQIDERDVTFDKVAYGVKRFIIGLAKKMLIANTLGAVADKIFEQPVVQFDALTAWIGAFAYSLQLFYDFSGYSDMAIGLGSIFGFKFLENFNYPYISKSITEFWRRWHISLSTWFKEYLYIPLGGNRVSKARNYVNLFIVFLATGFWHGAAWNFIFWGLWHGMFIIFEKATGWHKKEGNWKIATAQHIYCILAFVIGWVMFRADNMGYAWNYIKNMFGLISEHKIAYEYAYYIDNIEIIAFVAAILCAMPIFNKILEVKYERIWLRAGINIWLMFLFIFSSATIAASTYNPFIYFRF